MVGAPGLTSWIRVSAPRLSELPITAAPHTVTGAVAPARGMGPSVIGTLALANSIMFSFSVAKESGEAVSLYRLSIGFLLSSSRPPTTAEAISRTLLVVSAPGAEYTIGFSVLLNMASNSCRYSTSYGTSKAPAMDIM